MSDDWEHLADQFVDNLYESAKGYVRTYVLHHHLMRHLPPAPAAILDVGGGAGHQSFPLARVGYDVTLLEPSDAMLSKAEHRLASENQDTRARIRLIHASGEDAAEVTGGLRFAGVLCHGVIMYLEQPDALIGSLAECTAGGGVLSVMTLNAETLAIRPALERRWDDVLVAFDAQRERGVLGVETRGDTVEGLSEKFRGHGVEPVDWYGVLLFSDWMDLTAVGGDEVSSVAAVELQASQRDPYRQLSRAFHLICRRV